MCNTITILISEPWLSFVIAKRQIGAAGNIHFKTLLKRTIVK